LVVVKGERELAEVILALEPGCCLADLLHCGERKANENAYDGDHNQQLDQREGEPLATYRIARDNHWCTP
jgi:hypothetical protein